MSLHRYISAALLTILVVGCNGSAALLGPSPAAPTPTEAPPPGKPTQSLPTTAVTPAPTATATPGPPPAPEFPEAPERDLYRLAAELKGTHVEEADRVVNAGPVNYAEGRQDTFWLVDLLDLEVYSSSFELRLVTPHAYWYFEEGQAVDQPAIEQAAAHFEEEIFPRVTAAFGREWSPGVDNDPHLNILNARLRGVGGYYSSADEYPIAVNRFSNQREIIYINTGAIPVDSPVYPEVLAHELQHAAHWNADPSEDTWVNEGLSELAVTVAGFGQSSIHRFLRSPPTSLVHWPLSPLGSGANYGAASLFMHYLVDHYGGVSNVMPLLEEPGDGIPGINAFLENSGYDATFRDLFRDWAAANFLDEDRGIYGYSTLDLKTRATRVISDFTELTSQIPQYSVEYLELDSFDEPLQLQFSAPAKNNLLPTELDSPGCWWGNSGDSISSTLTRPVDLIGLDRATLHYQAWFEVEEDWDYAYLEVSVDGGRSWDILETPNTTAENPIGNSFGMGYTGDSGGWIEETVDLTGYVGQRILLRFHYVTDDAVNGSGICVRGLSIPQLGRSIEHEGWTAEGFVLTDNEVRQDYIVQVIQVGQVNRVTRIPLDENNSGSAIIAVPGELDQLVVAVAALAAKTRQEAAYTLTVGRVN